MSAIQSDSFRHGEKAFELLWVLTTEYWNEIQNGSGDTEARKVFGSSFAPRESVTLSKADQARRTFDYGGRSVLMEKHLKIGTADTRHNHQRTVTPELGKVDCIVAKFIAQYLLGESPALVPVKFLQFGQLRDLTGINLSEDLFLLAAVS